MLSLPKYGKVGVVRAVPELGQRKLDALFPISSFLKEQHYTPLK